jgi:tetratricopeptide (TPR) repeat protein
VTTYMTTLDDGMSDKKKAQRGKGGKDAAKPSKAEKTGADIIHVAFGPGGGRIAAVPPALPEPEPETTNGSAREPVTDTFTRAEVGKLLGMTPARLRSLEKAQIVAPSGTRNGKSVYTFQDLIAVRATHDLLARRVKIGDVARAIGILKDSLPRVTRPLQELRIVSDGRRMVVKTDGAMFEPLTGQMVLDFQVNALRDDVVRMLRPETAGARARTAYDLYTRASSLDEDPATFAEAEELYRRALELDPELAIAHTNLGNIRFRRGDEQGAEELYRRALEIDERQPEAHYNLGYVMLERGEPKRAIGYFEKALESDPRFADAHFNLAMAYEATGEKVRARAHWKRYLELEPTGTWADIAREHL